MPALLYIFIVSCFIIFYNYAGYAFLASFLSKLFPFRSRPVEQAPLPFISFIVAAYNEEGVIGEKIANTRSLEYPADRIEYIFITDGSTDQTAAIVAVATGIRGMHVPERRGKSAAMNRAVETAKGDVLIFSDANTTLNPDALLKIARHYADPKTGGVAGEKKVIHPTEDGHEVGAGEGLYWKYESTLKKIDSAFYSVVGAAGELFSVRRSLYIPLSPSIILDDFVTTLKIAEQGYRIIYEPEAYATEAPSFSMGDEKKRKVRIAAGGFQAIVLLRSLFKCWKHPRLSFLYISHRVLRWTLTPLCLLLALLSNTGLVLVSENPLFRWLLAGQVLFYLLAFLPLPEKKFKALKIPRYFVFMNLAVYAGFFRFLKGSQSASWEKARRAGEVTKSVTA